MPFTERQLRLIAKCKAAGYGWAKFASSVEQSGQCSPRQEDTLCSMSCRITQYHDRKKYGGYQRWHSGDWDDHNMDAAGSGYESNDY